MHHKKKLQSNRKKERPLNSNPTHKSKTLLTIGVSLQIKPIRDPITQEQTNTDQTLLQFQEENNNDPTTQKKH